MSEVPITIKPMVDTNGTPLQVANGITNSNLIRFREGYIEKLGGCSRLSSSPFTGTATAVLPWAALSGTSYVAVGTNVTLSVLAGGSMANITPASGVGSGDWSLDKWGQNLVGCPTGGLFVQWVPPNTGVPAAAVAGSPSSMNGVIVAAPQQQAIAWGIYSATLGMRDPLLIGWCDVANLNSWTATATNQAGSFRISKGSTIQSIMWFGLVGLVFTDLDLWGMTYAGFPLVYGFNQISPNCGLISRRAACGLGTRVPWMSQNEFFLYQGGSVTPLPCPVRSVIFGTSTNPGILDRTHLSAIHASPNTYGDEVMWRFPTVGSGGVCNAYVKWNATQFAEGNPLAWDYGMGAPNISSWSDQSVVGPPVGTDYNGLIQQFDNGSVDFDGVNIQPLIQTGWVRMPNGETFLERIRPDFNIISGSIQITVTAADEIPANAIDFPQRVYGPYTVDPTTPFVIVRALGKVFRLTITGVAPGTFFRVGTSLAIVQQDGSR